MQQNIPVQQLMPGMKIVALDIGWSKSPKWTAPFILNSGEDLALLLQCCKIVAVETKAPEVTPPLSRRSAPVEPQLSGQKNAASESLLKASDSEATNAAAAPQDAPQSVAPPESQRPTAPKQAPTKPIAKNPKPSADKSAAPADGLQALKKRITRRFVIDSFHESLDVLSQNFDRVRHGLELDPTRLAITSKKLMASTLARPGTLALLSQLEERDSSLERKSLDVAILSLNFAAQLGLSKARLNKICLSALLHDIGMTKIPEALLNQKEVLSVRQRISIQKHVHYSCDILHKTPPLRPLNGIVAYHHERFDGTGYPSGLAGRKIPLEARIIAISMTYEAMTRQRHFGNMATPTEALRKIYAQRNQNFDGMLVERFIRTVGVYPVGTLVELNKQQIGMVTDVAQTNRSRPTVRCLFDHQGELLNRQRDLDLSNPRCQAVKITRAVEPEELHNLSLERLAQDLGLSRVA